MATKKTKKSRLTVQNVKLKKAEGILTGDAKWKGKKYYAVLIPLDGLKEAETKES